MEDETFDFISPVSHLILNYASRQKRFSTITVLPYVQTQTHVQISESLGLGIKLLIVQKLPKAVTIDWAQVLRIIKDIRDIIIPPSISGNHIKAESLSIRLITLLPARPLVHLIFHHYWNSFILGHSQFTTNSKYFQAPPPFQMFGAALSVPAVCSVFQATLPILGTAEAALALWATCGFSLPDKPPYGQQLLLQPSACSHRLWPLTHPAHRLVWVFSTVWADGELLLHWTKLISSGTRKKVFCWTYLTWVHFSFLQYCSNTIYSQKLNKWSQLCPTSKYYQTTSQSISPQIMTFCARKSVLWTHIFSLQHHHENSG